MVAMNLASVVPHQFVKHAVLQMVAMATCAPVQTAQRLKVEVLLPVFDAAGNPQDTALVDWNFTALVSPEQSEIEKAKQALFVLGKLEADVTSQ